MRRLLFLGLALAVLAAAPMSAQAGWVSEWTNVALKPSGEKMNPQPSSMAIAGNRVRLTQAEVVTLVDYNAGTFTIMNPTKQYFWSGSIDDYVRESLTNRQKAMREKMASYQDRNKDKGDAKQADAKPPQVPVIDPAKLPPISITNTGQKETVAGFETTKYEIRSDGELFQEIWIAPIDVSSDLDFNRYLTQQRKMSAAMLGKTAGPYNALYLNEQYRQLLEKAFVLKLKTYHIGGTFERFATSMRAVDVPATQFDMPESYRRVRLGDVMTDPPKQAAERPGS